MGTGIDVIMGSCATTEVEGKTKKIQQDKDTGKLQQDPNGDEITLVFLELNGNPGGTIKLKLNLQHLLPLTLLEYICGLDSLPDSWNRKYLRESDLVLSIGDAAISGEMSLHQNGVTDGTVVTVTVSDAAAERWQQIKEQAEQVEQVEQAEQAKQQLGCYRRWAAV